VTGALLDPVEAHVAELERSLRGPQRDRRSLVREARDGLEDAVDAYRRGGMDAESAGRRAVRDFGPVADVAPLYQEELAAAQGRRTALLLAVALPALVLGWDFVWVSGLAPGPPVPPAVKVLAAVQDATSITIAVAALVLVALTFRRTRSPRWVAAAAAAAALTTAAVCGGATVAMSVLNPAEVEVRFLTQPVSVTAYVVSMLVMVLMNRSAVRTLRTLRRPQKA
jgi:hypothetical protein